MLKKFIGLSDDGFRVYECFTPGEAKGDVGIVMVIGYRDDEFKVYSSEVWNDPAEERAERMAQGAASAHRAMQKHFYGTSTSRGANKSNLAMHLASQLKPAVIFGDFAHLELRAAAMSPAKQNIIKPRTKKAALFDDMFVIDTPKLPADKQGQPKRKPQPNRGPIGRKDWK